MFNPGADLRVNNYPRTPAGRKAQAKDKLIPKLTHAHFTETLQKLDSLDKKKRASNEASRRNGLFKS